MDLLIWMVFIFFGIGQHKGNAESSSNPPLYSFGESPDVEVPSVIFSKRIHLNVNVSFFGTYYDTLVGVVSFGSTGTPLFNLAWKKGVEESLDKPFMAPFLYRGNSPSSLDSDVGRLFYRVVYPESSNENIFKNLAKYLKKAVINTPSSFKPKILLVVTWDRVAVAESAKVDPETSTFQAALASNGNETFAIFNYRQLNVSENSDNFLTGFNGGFGRGWYDVIHCKDNCTIRKNPLKVQMLARIEGSDQVGRFVFNVGKEELVRGGCLSESLTGGIFEVLPKYVDMLGGEVLRISAMCLPNKKKFYCRFGTPPSTTITDGFMVNEMRGFCPVPILTRRGQVLVSWSTDKKQWVSTNYISSVLNSRTKPTVQIETSVKEQWYERNAKNITLKWTPEVFSENLKTIVEARLIGYREDEAKDLVEFKVLEKLGGVPNGQGVYTFYVKDHKCKDNCEDFELGVLEVGLTKRAYSQATDRVALRFGPIPLGWYMNDALTKKLGHDWSDKKCKAWHEEDKKDTTWIDRLLRCPCTLDQALADFGRWQPDPGCNLYDKSFCYYHKNAKHCVRSVIPSKDGAGNQCCYNHDGTLRYSQLSNQGSTPDRGHVWGAAPYDKPNLVPDFSHWHHDVISFYYCCLWNEYSLCDLYMILRPTTSCRTYDVPILGYIRGDPHVSTIDGQYYHFGGYGDFWLIKSQLFQWQGRFKETVDTWDLGKLISPMGASWKPTALVCISVKDEGQIVQICPAPKDSIHHQGIKIRVGKDRKFFLSKSTLWQDFDDKAIVNNALGDDMHHHDNFTILLNNNVGIKVSFANGMLQVTVALPPYVKGNPSYQRGGLGLIGKVTTKEDTGYLSRSGSLIHSFISAQERYEKFSLTWGVLANESLFNIYSKPKSLDEYRPYFSFNDIPKVTDLSPSANEMFILCDDNSKCKWDYRITGNRKVAAATEKGDKLFKYLQKSATRVDNCGLPNVGRLAFMDHNDFSLGQSVTVTGCDASKQFTAGQSMSFKCIRVEVKSTSHEKGVWTDRDGEMYMVKWDPEPTPICIDKVPESESSDGISGGKIAALLVGILVAILAVVAMMIFLTARQRRAKQTYNSEGQS